MKPLVSIIMPTHEGSKVISRALDAVINQTYPNIELIIIDDNGEGTEEQINTQRVIERYMSKIDFKYIKHKKNINGSAARNTGMKAANGKYYAFLDDDDVLLPEKIEKQVEFFEKLDDSYGIVFCSGYIVKSNGIGYKLDIVEDDILYNLLCGKLRFNSSMIMIRSKVFEITAGFDETYMRHQDWEFCCRALSLIDGKCLPEYLVSKYVIDRNVPKNPEKAAKLRMYFLEKNAEIIKQFGKKREHDILSYHMRDLALNYIFNCDFYNAFIYLKKAGNPFIQFAKLMLYIFKRKTVHREKYADSIERYLNE